MRVAIGSDKRTCLTDRVVEDLRGRGHEVELYGPLRDEALLWPEVGRVVAERVASHGCDEGVLFCWTGTGVTIVANKVPGIRAALCRDAETARAARKWNHANVLVLSLRATSEAIACEIIDAWFGASFGDSDLTRSYIAKIEELERRYLAERTTSA